MEILHVCLCGPVTDGWNYQENLITKYHRKLGNNVTMIASKWIWNKNGKLSNCDKTDYINDDGVRMIRLQIKGKDSINKKFKRYKGIFESISSIRPDIIFIHGCQFIDIKHIVKYIKSNPNVIVYVDNHADLLNSGRNWLSRNILHRIIWKRSAKMIEPYVEKFYGVLPARVDFLVDIYDLPEDKVDLLVLGADDEKVIEAKNRENINVIKAKYQINSDDFLIMTGGKVDDNKTQTLLLMKAVKEIDNPRVKLIVFGSIDTKYQEEFNSLLCEKVKYIGWVNSSDTYKYFSAADIIVFPGLHSVFWEQVVGLGKPCVFRYMEGFTHIDLDGNCKFLYQDSVEEIKQTIIEIITNDNLYKNMKKIALTKGMDYFSYKEIARKSIGEVE